MPTLTLIRGASGSGKSTLAKALVRSGKDMNPLYYPYGGADHFEADQFWEFLGHGEYAFDGSKLGMAHEWCQNGVREALRKSHNVVVSNTFTTQKELQPYYDMVEEENKRRRPNYQYTVQEIICRGQFENQHGVPEEVVNKKRKALEL